MVIIHRLWLQTIITSIHANTYHLDHVIKLNEEDYKTVTFNVLYPGETKFASLTDYAQRVKKGYAESKLDKPTEAALPSTMTDKYGIDYRLEKIGIHLLHVRRRQTLMVQFIKNTAYYAKYVPVNQKYSVEYYYDDVKDSALTKVLGPETIGTRISTYPPENQDWVYINNGYNSAEWTVKHFSRCI